MAKKEIKFKERYTSDKSRMMALILCLAGPLGFHRMYVGKIGQGVVMLIVSLTIVGLWITAIWALVDFISILNGSFKDDQESEVKLWFTKR